LEGTRSYRSRWFRWALAGAIVAGLVAGVAGVALPFAISTDLVRDRLEREISEWTGHEVELLDKPEIGFWPVPRIELNRISVSSRQYPDAKPIVYADEMTVDFSILSALNGDPSFSNFVLVRPVFTVEKFADGATTWYSKTGRISEGMAISVKKLEASEEDSSKLGPIPTYRLGEVTVQNGTFSWIDHGTEMQEKFTALNGTISWPRLNGGMRANMRGIFRGEAASLGLNSTEPLLLLARNSAQVTFNLSSSPLTMTFDGMANLSDKPFFAGALTMASPSMRQTLQWAGTEIKPGEAIGALSLDAQIQMQNGRAMLNDLIVELEGNRGIGVLDFQNSEDGIPGISGTLAFNSLDVASFLRAFTPLPQSGEEIAETIDTSFLHQLTLDMRLSSQSATLGPLELSNLAAAARIVQGRAVFDIGDAEAYGGRMSGRIVIAESGIQGGGEIKVSARDINLAQALGALEIGGPVPQGVASLNIALSTHYPTWATGLSDLDGKFEISVTDGSIPSFDLSQFRELAASERFFGLSGISDGSFAFSSAEFKATFANGLAEINTGTITGENAMFDITGIIPYQRGGLALVGLLKDGLTEENTSEDETEDNAIQFFVGGSWPTPVISPIIGN
jgi:AsmA protein